ncbi:MAG: aldo/keto reductase [Streptosporangiaceae bacterium]
MDAVPRGDDLGRRAHHLGVTPAQVAVAWTRAHSRVVHPILGARRLDQIRETLAAADLTLPQDALARHDKAAAFDLGFPQEFVCDMQTFAFGEADALVDP